MGSQVYRWRNEVYRRKKGSMSLSSHGADPSLEVHVSCRHLGQDLFLATTSILRTTFGSPPGASKLSRLWFGP